MVKFFATFVLAVSASTAFAQEASESTDIPVPAIIVEGETADLAEYSWDKRPLVVFADSDNDPRFEQQMAYITDGLDELAERDVIVLTDTTPKPLSSLRKELRPRGFMLVLMGKDGSIYLRKPVPWDIREITRAIDKMPLRQQEIRDRREGR
ncbi:hypothetical protein ROA7450_02582 [Roseovarius albus]|uniref:DUF4174 domain-containing protein n=1 Tax=Roseovarius albus TaxID=1247867 RepID=A0A1X6ZHM7_9RHOB|nr:DUF4174 domain-containing protein [Roseovarius albus]SLN51521.1 hypothetical protein ROA7450_02582 [Roseovarius albus]